MKKGCEENVRYVDINFKRVTTKTYSSFSMFSFPSWTQTPKQTKKLNIDYIFASLVSGSRVSEPDTWLAKMIDYGGWVSCHPNILLWQMNDNKNFV